MEVFLFILLLLLLILQAIFSGLETGLTAVDKLKLKFEVEKGNKKAELLEETLNDPQIFLGTTLVGTNLTIIIISSIATYIAMKSMPAEKASFLVTVLVSPIMIIFGEMIPKMLFWHSANKYSIKFIRFLLTWHFIFFPIIKITGWITNLLTSFLGLKQGQKKELFKSKEELKELIAVSEEKGVFEETEGEMIEDIFEFRDTIAKEIMIPRVDVKAIEKNTILKEVWSDLLAFGYSRYPVYNDNIDKVVGILHILDFFNYDNFLDKKAEDVMRKPLFIPESKNLADLLKELKKRKVHIAVIVDEYGGTAGLITMEDLLEEIVGEIEDEFDQKRKMMKKLNDNSYLIDTRVDIEDLLETFEITLPEEEFEDIETLGGYIFKIAQKVPKLNELIKTDIGDFLINIADSRSIKVVRYFPVEKEIKDDSR